MYSSSFMSNQKRANDDVIQRYSKQMKSNQDMDTPLDRVVGFFDLIDKLKPSNTPELVTRQALAARASAEINTVYGSMILDIFEDRYKKFQDQIHLGRITFKETKLNGEPLSKVGEAYRLRLKSVNVSTR